MTDVKVETRTVVLCAGRPAVLHDTKLVDGVEVFRARQSDPVLIRILSGKAPRGKSGIAGTDIFSSVCVCEILLPHY